MSQQSLVIVVDSPDDQATATETAAANVVESLQSAGVVVIAATFGGVSLLPTPAEALRSAVDALSGELSKGGAPSKAALQPLVDRVDAAAAVVEALGGVDVPPATSAPAGGVALPDEPPAPPVGVPDLSAQSGAVAPA